VQIVSNGHVFDERTDWLEFLRKAANRPAEAPGLRCEVETSVGLSALASEIAGTPLETAMADAALKLIEKGTPKEMDVVRRLPYEKAPNGFDRLLTALQKAPVRFAREGWLASAYWKLFQLRPRDVGLHAALRRQLQVSPSDLQLQELADQYLTS
jgi:hypothetical protein